MKARAAKNWRRVVAPLRAVHRLQKREPAPERSAVRDAALALRLMSAEAAAE